MQSAMPFRCATYNNPKGNDARCTTCAADVMDVESIDVAKIHTLQAAKGRIKSALLRSGSGAEPPAPKKTSIEDPGSSPPLPSPPQKVMKK